MGPWKCMKFLMKEKNIFWIATKKEAYLVLNTSNLFYFFKRKERKKKPDFCLGSKDPGVLSRITNTQKTWWYHWSFNGNVSVKSRLVYFFKNVGFLRLEELNRTIKIFSEKTAHDTLNMCILKIQANENINKKY